MRRKQTKGEKGKETERKINKMKMKEKSRRGEKKKI